MGLTMFSPADDFFTDRLCRRYGVLVLLAAAILIAGAYSSDWALSCWPPSHLTGSQINYATHTCWNTGSFSIMDVESDQGAYKEDQAQFNFSKMRYFPVVLLLQMLVFLAPRALWRVANAISGYSTERLVRGCYALSRHANYHAGAMHAITPRAQPTGGMTGGVTGGMTGAARGYDALAASLVSALTSPLPVLGGVCRAFTGFTLVAAYMCTKVGYLLASLIQMAILGAYLDTNFFTLPLGGALWDSITVSRTEAITHGNITHHEERVSPLFPRAVMCEYKVWRLGNAQRYVLQCELSANLLVERLTVCLWIWLWITLLLLCVSTVTWFIRLAFYFIAPQHYKAKRVAVLLGRHCATTEPASQSYDKHLQEFAKLLLKPDGALVLEILEDNVSMIAASEVVKAAWVQFQANSEDQGATRRPTGPELGMRSDTVQSPQAAHAPTAQGPVISGVYPKLSGQPHSVGAGAPESMPLLEKTDF